MDTLYAWGENRYKQTSSREEFNIYAPSRHKDFEGIPVAQVAAGDYHSLVLTDGGDVYSFGRGSQGELGHPEKKNVYVPKVVAALKNEVCVDIACGSTTSFAITADGKVYQWGLILKEMNSTMLSTEINDTLINTNISDSSTTTTTPAPTGPQNSEYEYEAASGQLTGLAQNQHTTYIEADIEAREEFMISTRNTNAAERRQLRDIVKDSTERWMIAGDGADEEYLRQLSALGYQNEEIQAMKNNKEQEYHGMLRLGCKRVVQPLPQLIRGIAHLKIMKVSAGYAHCMLISDMGYLHAAGYNDRGQLGLGHRISTSEFKWVDYLKNQFVVQVVCGQQHTLCRAIDRHLMSSTGNTTITYDTNTSELKSSHMINGIDSSSAERMSEVYVGSTIGCNVYSWGNSMLGQLGLGRKGTSKGRFLPTLIPYFYNKFPNSIQDISAGHMFSVVVTVQGIVYSFGHAEYNQHGTGGRAYKDYTDPYHYFEPRQVLIKRWNATGEPKVKTVSLLTDSDNGYEIDEHLACISKVFCGSNYTIGIDIDGHAYSWGWNESGVLGHGVGYISSSPTIIRSLTMSSSNSNDTQICRCVTQIATGSKHILAITTENTYNISTHYQYLLSDSTYADMKILIDPSNSGHMQYLTCHSMILASRSAYFRGYLLNERKHISRNREFQETTTSSIIEIDMSGYEFLTMINVEIILKYIYTNQYPATWIGKKKQQLIHAAQYLCIYDLVYSLTNSSSHTYDLSNSGDHHNGTNTDKSNNDTHHATLEIQKLIEKKNQTLIDPKTSQFYSDFSTLFVSRPYFADVVFTYNFSKEGKSITGITENQLEYIYAHKAILIQMNYFEGMFHSHFKESTLSADSLYTLPSTPTTALEHLNLDTSKTDVQIDNTAVHSCGSNANLIRYTNATLDNTVKSTLISPMMMIQLDSILDEDLSYETFIQILHYAYTGKDPFDSWTNVVDSWKKNVIEETPADSVIVNTVESSGNNQIPINKNTMSANQNSNKEDLYRVVHMAIALCIACNRLGYTRLFTICENKLLTHLKEDYPYVAQLCLQVAQDYTFLKLERQCLHILRFLNHLKTL